MQRAEHMVIRCTNTFDELIDRENQHMHSSTQSPTIRFAFHAATLAIGLGCTLGAASTVHAADASGPGADAVRAKAAEVGGLNPMTTNPQWTPNGGVFQFYNDGDAAIYWSAATGAHLVHGDILGAWRSLGFENGLGYPFEDEGPASDVCGGGAERSQGFSPSGCEVLCWTPAVCTPDGLLTEAQVWQATCAI